MRTCVDLMPQSCRIALRKRRFIRRWALLYALAVLVLVASGAGVRMRTGPLTSERDSLESKAFTRWARHEEIQKLLVEIDNVCSTIRRYDRLASPVDVSDVLKVVSLAMPEAVTLTSVSLVPREERARRGASEEKKPETFLAIELEGASVDDMTISDFVSNLSSHELLSRVSLDFARSGEIATVDGRVFRIACRIDLDKTYNFDKPITEVSP